MMKIYRDIQDFLKNKIIILWLLLSYSCIDNSPKIYYYERKCQCFEDASYEARLFVPEGNKVSMKIYKYRGEEVRLVGGGFFQRKGNSIYRFKSKEDSIGQCYLTLQKDTCIIFKWSNPMVNNILQTCYRYIGITSMTINGKEQKMYKFERAMGVSNIIHNVYFTLDFIPVWEEYARGFTLMECDTKLVDDKEVPTDFKLQVEKIVREN